MAAQLFLCLLSSSPLPALCVFHSLTRAPPDLLLPQMNHTQYLGHHLELGMSGLEFDYAEDCWARDLRILNADNAVLVAMARCRRCYCSGCCRGMPGRHKPPADRSAAVPTAPLHRL